MTKALHLIARQEGISPKGLSPAGNMLRNEYKSGCWVNLGDDPRQLIGGWLYLHENSITVSKMGGRVSEVVPCLRKDAVITQGFALVFLSSEEAKGIKWRGSGVGRGHGGIIDATLPHE